MISTKAGAGAVLLLQVTIIFSDVVRLIPQNSSCPADPPEKL